MQMIQRSWNSNPIKCRIRALCYAYCMTEPESATDSLDVRETLKELELLDQVRDARRKERGIDYYIPNPMQFKAHKSKAKIILFCGGNRSGKSTFGAVELTYHLTRKYPDWFPQERRFRRPIKAVVVCDANQKIDKVIEPKIREFLPPGYITHTKRITGGFLNRIVCADGSTVDFLSSEQDDMAFEGADFDFYWGDEPQKKKKFDAIMRGMVDRGGRSVLTFTPLIEPWMKEELVDRSDGKSVESIIVDMRDNKWDIKGNPILTEENIVEQTRYWDEETVETRMHGKFFHLRGIVYGEFSEVHQVEFDYQYPDPVIAILDPHDRQPHHVVWAICDKTNDLFIHSELSKHCTVAELAGLIKAVEKSNGYRMRKRLIDPNFGRKPLITTGRNMIQELAIAGCGGWHEADDPKDEGRLKVKEYLHFDKRQPVSHTNKPKLYFHKQRVPLTIKSIRNHQYEEWVGKIASERDPKEKPKDKDTHGADVIRYLCMSNPKFSPLTEKNYELETSPY